MTAIRVSCVFRPETEFCEETPSGATWYRLPTGLTVDYNPQNNMQTYTEIGNKFPSNIVAGMFSGSGSVKFKLDYQCINFLGAVFENYEYEPTVDGEIQRNTHLFSKKNGKRVKSFSLRFKKLNAVVGGGKDSVITLRGCVGSDFSQSQSSGNAVQDATVSFQYAKESMVLTDLDETDWEGFYDTEDACVPVEWACLNIGDEPVAYTESVSFGVKNSLEMIKGCGIRFNSNYREGPTNVSLSTSCYAVDEKTYYTRMYSGGVVTNELEPRAKGLKPIDTIKIKSTMDGDTYKWTTVVHKVYVDSDGSRNYNPSSRINDSPSFKVQGPFEIYVKNTSGKITIWD